MLTLYTSAFFMGLFGSLHCVAMCGGISVAFNQTMAKDKAVQLVFVYQFFRIISYAILGVTVAALGTLFPKTHIPVLAILSGCFLIFLALYLLNLSSPLQGLEKITYKLWQRIKPIQRSLLPMDKPSQAAGIGLLWGLLPCGLVYSALGLAVSSGSAIDGCIIMLFFGLGTLPLMLLLGGASRKLVLILKKRSLRILAASIFFLLGCFYIYSAINNPHQHIEQELKKKHAHKHHEMA